MDLEELLETTVKWTLVFWLPPYIAWYFSRTLFGAAWNWITEPIDPIEQG